MLSVEEVLAAALADERVAYQVQSALTNELTLRNPFQGLIAERISHHLTEYGSPPRQKDLEVWAETLGERRQRGVMQELKELRQKDLSGYTFEFLADHAVEQLRREAAENFKSRIQQIDDITVEDVGALYKKLEAISPVTLEGVADLRDVDKHATPEVGPEHTWTTGITGLDKLTGGWREGELVFIFADTGDGKSVALVNHSHAAALVGANVLHITLELSQEAAAGRFYRRMAEVDKSTYESENEAVRKKLKENYWKVAKGEIRLLYRPPYTITPSDLRSMIELHQQQYGKVDVLALDYLDLMQPGQGDRGRKRYEQLGRISHQVKGLAEEYGFTILSATQARRPSGKEHQNLRRSDIGDSYQKMQAADLAIGLVRTEEEAQHHMGRYHLAKVRESGGHGTDITLYINFDLMIIRDAEDWYTKCLMEDLGHSFGPATDFGEPEE